jgi:hypothetical protein
MGTFCVQGTDVTGLKGEVEVVMVVNVNVTVFWNVMQGNMEDRYTDVSREPAVCIFKVERLRHHVLRNVDNDLPCHRACEVGRDCKNDLNYITRTKESLGRALI